MQNCFPIKDFSEIAVYLSLMQLDALVGKQQASTSQKSAMHSLRKRQAAASEAAAKAKPTSSFGALVRRRSGMVIYVVLD